MKTAEQILRETHEGAKPIAFQMQDGIPAVWCIVDTEAPKTNLSLAIFGTGHEVNGAL